MPQVQGNKTTGKLEGLQVLRGVAALLVMWCHLKHNLNFSAAQLAQRPLIATDLGAIGVDIFFVISGFVIAMSAENVGQNWRHFLAQRIARIVPLYFTISGCLIIVSLLPGAITPAISTPHLLSFPVLFNTFAFLPIFDRSHFTNPVCLNGWTLSFEMWFYVCLALLIKFGNGQKAGRRLPLIMALGTVLIALFYHSTNWYLPKFMFHPLVLEFSAGCLLYHARHWLRQGGMVTLYLLGFILFFLAVRSDYLAQHIFVLADPKLGFERAAIWGGFAVCLVGVTTQVDLKYPRSWPKFFLLLGDASYSIYLIAPLVAALLALVNVELGQLSGPAHFTLPSILNGCLYVLGTVLGGILLWKYFEVPATQKTKQFLARFAPKTTGPEIFPAMAKTE